MKKFLIILIVIVIGLGGLNIYEFLNMQNSINKYNETQDNYHEILNEEIEKKNELVTTKDELETLKINNLDNNKELEIWTNLIETVENLLK